MSLPSTSMHCGSGTVLTVKRNIRKNHITYQWFKKKKKIFHVYKPTVVLKMWLVFHLWGISLMFRSQNENLKSNFMLNLNKEVAVVASTFQAVFTFSFTFFSTEAPEDISLKLLLSFWLVESEVQQGLLVLWLVEREDDLTSRLVPGLCVTVTTHVWFECL